MSDFSSHQLVNEHNSGCESDSEAENQREIPKNKSRRKKRHQQQREDPAMNDGNHQRDTQTDGDETESQLNFDGSPASSTPLTLPVSSLGQDKMRRRLQFFFMNPIEKWQAKRRWALGRMSVRWQRNQFSALQISLQVCSSSHQNHPCDTSALPVCSLALHSRQLFIWQSHCLFASVFERMGSWYGGKACGNPLMMDCLPD